MLRNCISKQVKLQSCLVKDSKCQESTWSPCKTRDSTCISELNLRLMRPSRKWFLWSLTVLVFRVLMMLRFLGYANLCTPLSCRGSHPLVVAMKELSVMEDLVDLEAPLVCTIYLKQIKLCTLNKLCKWIKKYSLLQNYNTVSSFVMVHKIFNCVP